jgi:hypothetical protein
MSPAKSNLIRSICRFVEVLLFFVISVVAFNLFAKTNSLNSKAKAKSLSGSPVAPRELSVADISLHCGLNPLYTLVSPRNQEHTSSLLAQSRVQSSAQLSVGSNHRSGDHVFMEMTQHRIPSLPYCSRNRNNSPLSFLLFKPGNLFQQNPVLLI